MPITQQSQPRTGHPRHSGMEEDVRGVIVGGDWHSGRLCYEGRQQGPALHEATEDDLRAAADREFARIREECGEAFRTIYPAASWELRILS